jgi:hypothetical protein
MCSIYITLHLSTTYKFDILAMVPHLPPEMWFLVAEHLREQLSNSKFEQLLGINKVFYDIVMKRKYEKLHLGASCPEDPPPGIFEFVYYQVSVTVSEH